MNREHIINRHKINYRLHGEEPYKIIVIHGGPGAPGSASTLAKMISKKFGVVEILQKADSIEGQLGELLTIIDEVVDSKVVLVGHSWGAWISYIFAAKHSQKVSKIILIGSGAYEDKYLKTMHTSRQSRLSSEESERAQKLFKILTNNDVMNKSTILKEFGELMEKADSYQMCEYRDEIIEFQSEAFNKLMEEANKLRSNGELIDLATEIRCSVIAIHGDYDSHPYQGVKEPLSKACKNFKFYLLEKCGHTPWNELHAKDIFNHILMSSLETI